LNNYEKVLVNYYLFTHSSDIRPYFNQFTIYTSEERPFLEGLLVPIVVKRGAGPGPGIGPFLVSSFSVRAIIIEGAFAGTELQVPTVQPSQDGWELGATIKLPFMPDCNKGDTRRGYLSFASYYWGPDSISIPFTIQCLSELSFSRGILPQHVPEGAQVEGPAADGTVTVNIFTGTTYRFSELLIGEGGILKVNYTQGANPAVVEVTGNIDVQGTILSTGDNGIPGGEGKRKGPWYDTHLYGGSGGWGGFPNGGKGGRGGPWSGTISTGCIDEQAAQHDCVASCGDLNLSGFWPTTCPEGTTCVCYADYGFSTSDCIPLCGYVHVVSQDGEKGDNSPVPNGGTGGLGGHEWNPGSGLALVYNIFNLATALRNGPTAIIDAVEASVGIVQEGWKIFANANGEVASAGQGGYGPQGYPPNLSSFSPPLGGGGAGGAGKMDMNTPFVEGDAAGGGGGGGGGGAPSLKLVTPGRVIISSGGSVNGRGGNGGRGGKGSTGPEDEAAGGGGGGGGNGAQIHIIAGEVINNGAINLKRGVGGASAFFLNSPAGDFYPTRDCGVLMPGSDLVCPEGQSCIVECGEWDFDCTDPNLSHVYCVPQPPQPSDILFVGSGFGAPGKDGVLRVDGNFGGALPQFAGFYRGLRLPGPLVQVTSNPQFCEVVLEGQSAFQWCFDLQGGLNVLTGYRTLHPWQKQFVFYYSGRQDSDGDGLSDPVELMLGTNANNPDSDGDGLTDFAEAVTYRTNPLKWDTDGDGYSDGYEVAHGTNPKDPSYTITITKAGAGGGLVTSSPLGLDCGSNCQATFLCGARVTLQASPSPGSYFAGWSMGGYSTTNPSFGVWVNANANVVATFEVQKRLTVVKEGAGGGLVTSSPLGLDCGSTCQATFDRNLKVTLQASPSTGSYFTGWSGGGCTGTAPSCTINSLSTDTTVVANFELQKTLTVTKTGAGSGVVTSSPPGVDCGSTCQATYTHGTMVDLHAVASLGYYLAGWSGGGCSGNATICTVTIAADTTVTANFEIPIPGALMTVARKNHTATLLSDGRVFLAGGWDSTGNILPSAELYDSATSTFSSTGSMATGRVGHTATLLPNGKVLLTGGEESNNPHYNPYTLSTAELYDHTTGTFDPTGYLMEGIGYMREAHVGQTATLLPFEPAMVLIIGGWPVIPWYQAGSSEIYSVDGGWFGSAAESYRMIEERSDHTATLLLDGKVLVAGGSDANGTYLDSAELYTINELDAFSATGSMATVRGGGHTATLLPDGKVLVVGGSVVDFGILSSAELYDPATGMFSFAGDMTAARAGHTATLLNNGKVLIAGGHGYYDEGVWSSAELYDPATETFTATGSMMVTRAYHTATLLKNGKVLIAGGYSDVDGALSSAEIYDPETGTFSSTAPSDN
jgi:hypothetical protein